MGGSLTQEKESAGKVHAVMMEKKTCSVSRVHVQPLKKSKNLLASSAM